MKLPEPIIGEVIVFVIVVSIIGGICAVASLPFAAYGFYKCIFEVVDDEKKTQTMG